MIGSLRNCRNLVNKNHRTGEVGELQNAFYGVFSKRPSWQAFKGHANLVGVQNSAQGVHLQSCDQRFLDVVWASISSRSDRQIVSGMAMNVSTT
jgi:hypothetical protein